MKLTTGAAPQVPAAPPRRDHAELLIALLNALIMRGGERAWRRSIWLSIFKVKTGWTHKKQREAVVAATSVGGEGGRGVREEGREERGTGGDGSC